MSSCLSKIILRLALVFLTAVFAVHGFTSEVFAAEVAAPEQSIPEQTAVLHGTISEDVKPDPIKEQVDRVMLESLARNEDLKTFSSHVNKYSKPHQKLMALTRDALNYVMFYRGALASTEAREVILDEQPKSKSDGSAQYHRQRVIDDTELTVVSNMMQLASALGSADLEAREREVTDAMANLKQVAGDEGAQKAFSDLEAWSKGIEVENSAYKRSPWSISDKRLKLQQIAEGTLATDPVIAEIRESLNDYSHSKGYLATTRTIQSALGIGCLTPSIVATACQVVQFGLVMATGGSEEDKLLKEIYLDKRLEHRSHVINEKAHMALDNYQIAVMQKNPVLLAFCESMIRQMAGADGATDIITGAKSLATRIPAQEQAETQQKTDNTPPDNI